MAPFTFCQNVLAKRFVKTFCQKGKRCKFCRRPIILDYSSKWTDMAFCRNDWTKQSVEMIGQGKLSKSLDKAFCQNGSTSFDLALSNCQVAVTNCRIPCRIAELPCRLAELSCRITKLPCQIAKLPCRIAILNYGTELHTCLPSQLAYRAFYSQPL